MFYFNGVKYIMLNCLIQLFFDFNFFGGVNYNRVGKDCKKNVWYNIFFFIFEFGNRYEEWSINVYEGRFGYYM